MAYSWAADEEWARLPVDVDSVIREVLAVEGGASGVRFSAGLIFPRYAVVGASYARRRKGAADGVGARMAGVAGPAPCRKRLPNFICSESLLNLGLAASSFVP